MNNVLPRVFRMHLKFDLKGSTYKRRASKKEREKSKPTFKDLDFMQDVPDGLLLDTDTYNALVKTLQRDCLVSGCLWVCVCWFGLSLHIKFHQAFTLIRNMNRMYMRIYCRMLEKISDCGDIVLFVCVGVRKL